MPAELGSAVVNQADIRMKSQLPCTSGCRRCDDLARWLQIRERGRRTSVHL